MHRHTPWMTALIVLLVGTALSADRVRLRSGKIVDGTFIGADSKAVRVLLADGKVSEIPIQDAVAVEFTPRKPPAPPPAPKPAAAKPERPPLVVPSGTALNVRLTQPIDVDVSYAGQTFKGLVDDPVTLNGVIAIPRGAAATLQAVAVKQSGTMKGSDKISLKVHSIAFGGNVYDVSTGYLETKGKGEGKKTGRKVGAGAGLGGIIGGIAGGGSGAAVGAVVGGLGGAAVASGGEEHLKIDVETRLQFQLVASLSIRP